MSFSAGPWHPDKAHAERWAAWLRAHGEHAEVQSNDQAGFNVRASGAEHKG